MENLENLQTYYMLYNLIRDKPRYNLKVVAKALGISGRGQSYTTASNYITKLYEKKISIQPKLIPRTFENWYAIGYFLKVKTPQDLTPTFLDMSQDAEISYVLLLSGKYDFFVTSKSDITFDDRLTIEKQSIMYTPIFTIPKGWKLELKESFKQMESSDFSKGKINRIMEDFLPWNQIHYNIFEIMKGNIQIPFLQVAEKVGLSPNTVKKYFYNDILPYCDIAHYFFPKGYGHYHQSLVIAETDYEKGVVKSLQKLPCTSYVYPLEEELVLTVFHEDVVDLMVAFKRLEEKGIVRKHLLLVPLYWE
ncbi:MAG: hypothetical protein PVF58_09310 [Candidatus Methanofastidiosia archaeon]|jgi:hypothetical protein